MTVLTGHLPDQTGIYQCGCEPTTSDAITNLLVAGCASRDLHALQHVGCLLGTLACPGQVAHSLLDLASELLALSPAGVDACMTMFAFDSAAGCWTYALSESAIAFAAEVEASLSAPADAVADMHLCARLVVAHASADAGQVGALLLSVPEGSVVQSLVRLAATVSLMVLAVAP